MILTIFITVPSRCMLTFAVCTIPSFVLRDAHIQLCVICLPGGLSGAIGCRMAREPDVWAVPVMAAVGSVRLSLRTSGLIWVATSVCLWWRVWRHPQMMRSAGSMLCMSECSGWSGDLADLRSACREDAGNAAGRNAPALPACRVCIRNWRGFRSKRSASTCAPCRKKHSDSL